MPRKEAQALYDYTAKSTEELSITKGERLRLFEDDQAKLDAKNWWQVENSAGNSGFVPKNYLQLVKDAPVAPRPVASPAPAAASGKVCVCDGVCVMVCVCVCDVCDGVCV